MHQVVSLCLVARRSSEVAFGFEVGDAKITSFGVAVIVPDESPGKSNS
jgi:hypothetical protein